MNKLAFIALILLAAKEVRSDGEGQGFAPPNYWIFKCQENLSDWEKSFDSLEQDNDNDKCDSNGQIFVKKGKGNCCIDKNVMEQPGVKKDSFEKCCGKIERILINRSATRSELKTAQTLGSALHSEKQNRVTAQTNLQTSNVGISLDLPKANLIHDNQISI